MNNLDKSYQALLQDILDNGVEKGDRTGTGTISVFGRQIRHKMSEGFPLLTTKKMAWKVMVAELLWFLRGDTNIKFLLDYDCHIWDGDAYKGYEAQCVTHSVDPMSKEQFISAIKLGNNKQPHFIPDLTGYKLGDLGPIYGKQWRSWKVNRLNPDTNKLVQPIDQISNLIEQLKTNPDSRRLMVSAWNVSDLDKMVLPPCHYGFQIYTRPTTRDEKIVNPGKYRAISLMWNQRSVDTFLGLPFNIASYGLLLEIIAKEVNMIPDELIGNLGDVHLYSNHIEQAKEQIGRELTLEERMHWWFENHKPNRDVCDNIDEQSDYAKGVYFDSAGVPKRTREPYELPSVNITERNWYLHHKVKEHLGPKSFDEKIMSYRPDCFELVGYTSHPKIKAPLSN
jgi:thymidylate synthase